MRVIRGMRPLEEKDRGACFAIGNFDGVHRGHKVLIEEVISQSRSHGVAAGVLVFEPHPREFFQPDEPHFRLTPLAEKTRLFESLGLDLTVVLDFDQQLSSLTAHEFIADKLVVWLGARHVVVGSDFRFGKDRTGTAETLAVEGGRLGFGVSIIDQQRDGRQVLSSTLVRDALAVGDVRQAAMCLGHWWRECGRIIRGAQIGSELGFPTANIKMRDGVILAHGIYAVWVWHAGQRLAGAAYYGGRPTIDGGDPALEVFIFDFDGDLYGQEIAIEFVDHIRADARFDTPEALKIQMARDCETARAMLDVAGSAPNLAAFEPQVGGV